MSDGRTLNDVLAAGVTSDNPLIALFSKLHLAKSGPTASKVASVQRANGGIPGTDPLEKLEKLHEQITKMQAEQAKTTASMIKLVERLLERLPANASVSGVAN